MPVTPGPFIPVWTLSLSRTVRRGRHSKRSCRPWRPRCDDVFVAQLEYLEESAVPGFRVHDWFSVIGLASGLSLHRLTLKAAFKSWGLENVVRKVYVRFG